MKEYKIGEVFEDEGKNLQCVESFGCNGCYYNDMYLSYCKGECSASRRKDRTSVIFKEVNVTRIIVSEKENGICYTFVMLENMYSLSSLKKGVKAGLLAKEKELKKVWNAGTKLTANIYLNRNFACSIDFEL